MITKENFEEIFEITESNSEGDKCFQGLLIISKYINPKKNKIIFYGEKDMIYSVDVNLIIDAGITEEDAILLASLNWGICDESDSLYCFV